MRRRASVVAGFVLAASLLSPAHAAAIVDDFSRTVSRGWGTGALGRWSLETTSGAALSLSVSGGVARAVSASGQRKANVFVGPAFGGPVEASASFTTSTQPGTGLGNQVHLLLRRAGIRTYYSAAVVPQGSGLPARLSILSAKDGLFDTPATAALPFEIVPGIAYRIEALVVDSPAGTTVSAKAWPAASAEPAAWLTSFTDTAVDRIATGSPGIRLSLASKVTVTVDDVSIERLPPPVTDGFDRTRWTWWGAGPLGTWSWETTSGAALSLSVDGTRGLASSAAGVNKGAALVGGSRSGTTRVSATASVDRQPASGTPNHWHVLARRAAIRTYYSAYLMPGSGDRPATLWLMTAKDGSFDNPAEATMPFSVVPGTEYTLELLVEDAPDGVSLRARAWPTGTTAPAGWPVSWIDTAPDRILTGWGGVRISIYSSPATVSLDEVTIGTS